jgi:hypothetical protein
MMNLTPLQLEVLDQAVAWLKDKPWYKGVLMSGFPSDADIVRDGVEDSAAQVMMDTARWDAPDFMNP